MHFLAST